MLNIRLQKEGWTMLQKLIFGEETVGVVMTETKEGNNRIGKMCRK
jgi:hypothetical protein